MSSALVRITIAIAAALAPALATPATVAIVGGNVHTVTDRGMIAGATVLIEDGRIVAVGTDVVVPDGATRVEARGKVVTPGIFEPYSAIGLVEVSLVDETADAWQSSVRFSAAFDVVDAINPHSVLIPVNRLEGVTRAMVAPQLPQNLQPGVTAGPITGVGAVIDLGGGRDFLVARGAAMFALLDEQGALLAGGSRTNAFLALEEALQDAADYRDHRAAFEQRSRRDYALGRLDLEALQPVLAGRTKLVVTAERASDIEAALRLAARYSLALVIAGAAEGWTVADQLAAARVPVILNPLQDLPGRFDQLGSTLENASRLHAAGVTIAFSIGDSHNAGNNRQAAGNAVAHGLPWPAALAALTINPARIYGLDARVGTVEPGKDADLVVWDGDPLEVTSAADQVLIGGEVIPMVSRQTLLRDRYENLAEPLPPAYR
jgi:imidazolonepropionase-like amidohydrolase